MTLRRGFALARSVLSWLVLLVCLACLAGALWWVKVAHAGTGDGVDIDGFRPYLIATGSMAPDFEVDSFVLTRDTPFDQIRGGAVVPFRAAGIGGAPALHRVVTVERDKTGQISALIVKGDNNPHPDGAPVTRQNYLGRAVFHTNLTAFIAQQAAGPHGRIRVIAIPIVVLALVWLSWRYLVDGRRPVTKVWAASLIVACLLASVTFTYAHYLDQQQGYIVSRLGDYADRYESQTGESMSIEGADVLGTIDIPRINVHYPIIEYVSASSLNLAITHFAGPALDQPGNVVLAGHRAWDNLFFTRIDQLQPGDRITVTDADRKSVTYVVTGHRQVTPDDLSVLRQPKDGLRHLTLISCTYDLRNRYIVTAVAEPDTGAAVEQPTAAATETGIWPDHALPVAVVLAVVGGVGALVWAASAVLAWRRRRRVRPEPDSGAHRA